MRMRTILAAIMVSGIVVAAVAVAAIQLWPDGNGDAGTTTLVPAATSTESSSSGELSLSSSCLSAADVYQNLRPAVVRITSSAASSGPFGQPAEGSGSGIVIDEGGSILTNNHVIAGADILEVKFADGSLAPASVVGRDPGNDLAVIEVDPVGLDLTVARLGDSDAVRVGDPVLAIGNPFSLEGTLTQGIVSGVGRTFAQGGSTRPIRDMIQTDAPVNPGNSGGPLLDCRGEVIGINTLLENPTGDNVNVGVAFAVPAGAASRSLPEMLAGETVSHPWLGIAGQEITPGLAQELDLSAEAGVYVSFVASGGPAESAGVRGAFGSEGEAAQSPSLVPGGDVIVSVDGVDVGSVEELAGYFDREKRPGDTVELEIVRDGEELSLEATLAQWPD